MSFSMDALPDDLFFDAVRAETPEASNEIVDRMRAEDPVHFVPGLGFWVVTRHDDIKRLFHDPENVTNDPRAFEHHVPRGEEGSLSRWAENNGLFSLPDADHARIRRLVSAAFTPRAVRRMDEQIRAVVSQFTAPLQGRSGETVDFMNEFTNPIPNVVISRITGVPPGEDEVRFRELAQQTIRGFFTFSAPEVKKASSEAFEELAGWVRELAKERRDAPREDLISDLIRAQDRDEKLQDDEIIILITGLIGAGSETTALGGMVAITTLLKHPDVMERLRSDRSLIPNAINEVMRFGFGGPGGLPRYAARDFELRGKSIRKGQMMMLSFAGTNRDPEVWPDPHVFDIDRDCRNLNVFGGGPHYCLGANLARGEMGAMVDAILDVVPEGSTIDEEAMRFEEAGFFKRPMNLPIQLGP
jgi:cytochrome P450